MLLCNIQHSTVSTEPRNLSYLMLNIEFKLRKKPRFKNSEFRIKVDIQQSNYYHQSLLDEQTSHYNNYNYYN